MMFMENNLLFVTLTVVRVSRNTFKKVKSQKPWFVSSQTTNKTQRYGLCPHKLSLKLFIFNYIVKHIILGNLFLLDAFYNRIFSIAFI